MAATEKTYQGTQRRQFQNVSVRSSSRRSGNFNHRHTKRIPRIEISDQRRDRPKWGVLKLAQRGFTLIELMVVIVILGILATLIVPNIMDKPGKAKQLKAKIQLESIETALKLYKLDNGAYPSTEQGLQALVTPPTDGTSAKNFAKEGYLEKGAVPKDPWDNEYIYLCPGVNSTYDIVSYGADGVPGGEDENKDVTSWETGE